MDEQIIQCTQACTITVQHEFVIPVLSLTTEQGFQIGAAIIGCWAAGWAIRVLIQTLREGSRNIEENNP